MGKLWSIIYNWRYSMEFPPSRRQIALRLGVAPTTLDTWEDPTDMPKRHNLYAISMVTGKPYQVVVQAAVDDIKLFDEASAKKAWERRQGRKLRIADGPTIKP